MDDIFSRLLSLTSCITRRVIEFFGEHFSVIVFLVVAKIMIVLSLERLLAVLSNFSLQPGVSSLKTVHAEDIVLRDVIRLLRDSEINSCCKQLTSGTWTGIQYSSTDYASSSRDCSSTSLGFLERDALIREHLSFISSGSEIVNRNYSRSVHFIFKGYCYCYNAFFKASFVNDNACGQYIT